MGTALSKHGTHRTMFAEGEIPGVTANASLKLSRGPSLTVVFLIFSALAQGRRGVLGEEIHVPKHASLTAFLAVQLLRLVQGRC